MPTKEISTRPEIRELFIKPENLPGLREEFQTIINNCKPHPQWRMAYAKFALAWNRKFWETLWRIPQHMNSNSSWLFTVYSIQDNTREAVEKLFWWIFLRVWHKTTPQEELWDNISLLPEDRTWKHTDEPEALAPKDLKDNKLIDTLTENSIYEYFSKAFLACDDILNPEKILPGKEEIIIDTEKWTVKCKRDYMSRISASQKDVVIDFTVWFRYKR